MYKPNLESTQFALIVADSMTGHVLNANFQVYIGDDSATYFIFDDLKSVRDFINQVNGNNHTYDYAIYNSDYDLVDFIRVKK
jgi:surface antigen